MTLVSIVLITMRLKEEEFALNVKKTLKWETNFVGSYAGMENRTQMSNVTMETWSMETDVLQFVNSNSIGHALQLFLRYVPKIVQMDSLLALRNVMMGISFLTTDVLLIANSRMDFIVSLDSLQFVMRSVETERKLVKNNAMIKTIFLMMDVQVSAKLKLFGNVKTFDPVFANLYVLTIMLLAMKLVTMETW